MMDQQRSSWTVKKSYSHKSKKRSVKIVSFNHDKKIQMKNVDIKAEKEGKREKNKKRTRKSFTKVREDGNINGHSTRESSERTLKTERERIKHNVNESLEINRKQKRAKQTKRLSERNKRQWRV